MVHDVGQLVGTQPLATSRRQPAGDATDEDIRTALERKRRQRPGEIRGPCALVDADRAELRPERALHRAAHSVGQRVATSAGLGDPLSRRATDLATLGPDDPAR